MAPKKRNFHTPRNTKNIQVSKNDEKKNVESSNEINESVEVNSDLPAKSDFIQSDKYGKRTVENNWLKYDEPQSDPHAESMRGKDFNVLLSYSGGSGSQLKLQDEKEWEDELSNDISLDIQDLVHAMKCIPFHERIGLKNIFDETVIQNFISVAKSYEMSYKAQSKLTVSESESSESKEKAADLAVNLIKEPCLIESDEEEVPIKNITVQDKTEDIINSLASNLSFKTFSEKDNNIEKVDKPSVPEEKKTETSNDLDFLLSLNISSNISAKQESSVPKNNTNVDDWLNSILDD